MTKEEQLQEAIAEIESQAGDFWRINLPNLHKIIRELEDKLMRER